MTRQLIAGLVLAVVLVASACTGEAEVVVDTTELPITTEPTTTITTTTLPPSTTVPPSTTDSSTESSDAESSDAESSDTGGDAALPGFDGTIDPNTLDEFEEAIKTDEGREQFIDTVVAAVPALTREQASCFLDNVDVEAVVSFTGGGVENLTAEQVADIVAVFDVCEIAIEALLASGGTS